ncbi:MAG: MarR family transcriptional regulator [Clostridia bacterium]|nr:MarR family transcriptional regulator [Clostridia bacterium]
MKKEEWMAPVMRSYHPQPTPPMLVNEVARLFQARMRMYDLEGVMAQDSARLIMRALIHADGCSQLDLVRQTHLKPPTVSVTLRRMETEGLVRREQNEQDLRAVRVFLTEEGKAHNRQVRDRLHALDAVLMQGFSKEETETLRQLLERMRDNILSPHPENNS